MHRLGARAIFLAHAFCAGSVSILYLLTETWHEKKLFFTFNAFYVFAGEKSVEPYLDLFGSDTLIQKFLSSLPAPCVRDEDKKSPDVLNVTDDEIEGKAANIHIEDASKVSKNARKEQNEVKVTSTFESYNKFSILNDDSDFDNINDDENDPDVCLESDLETNLYCSNMLVEKKKIKNKLKRERRRKRKLEKSSKFDDALNEVKKLGVYVNEKEAEKEAKNKIEKAKKRQINNLKRKTLTSVRSELRYLKSASYFVQEMEYDGIFRFDYEAENKKPVSNPKEEFLSTVANETKDENMKTVDETEDENEKIVTNLIDEMISTSVEQNEANQRNTIISNLIDSMISTAVDEKTNFAPKLIGGGPKKRRNPLRSSHNQNYLTNLNNKNGVLTGQCYNANNDCFVNSLVNILANTEFRSVIMNMNTTVENQPVTLELQKIFKQMGRGDGKINTRQLRCRIPGYDDKGQHDVFDFWRALLEVLVKEEAAEYDPSSNLNQSPDERQYEQYIAGSKIKRLVTWVIEKHFTCIDPECGKKIKYDCFDFYALHIPPHGQENVTFLDCLNHTGLRPTEPRNRPRCRDCNKVSDEEFSVETIKTIPKVAVFQLIRATAGMMNKNFKYIECPGEIEVNDKKLKMKAKINHIGASINTGKGGYSSSRYNSFPEVQLQTQFKAL